MAASALDIVSAERLLRELRLRATVPNVQRAGDLIRDAVDIVAKYTYPLIDSRRWYRFARRWPANRDFAWQVRLPGLTQLHAVGYWPANRTIGAEPPQQLDPVPGILRRGGGLVDIYPPAGGWPTNGAEMWALDATRGWTPDGHAADSIVRAIILWARELHDEVGALATTHPVWTIMRNAQPALIDYKTAPIDA